MRNNECKRLEESDIKKKHALSGVKYNELPPVK